MIKRNRQISLLHDIVAQSPSLAPSSREKYARDLDAWILFAGADPRGWTRQRAQDFYTRLAAQGLRPQSANRLMASVRFASQWWALRESRPELDFAVIQTASPTAKLPKRALTVAEAQRLLGTCDGSPHGLRDCALLVLELETGMRRMSISSIAIDRLAPAAVHVRMKGHGTEYVPVPLSDTATAAIAPWRTWLATVGRQTRGPLFRGLTRQVDVRGRTATRVRGTAISPSAIQKIVATRATRAGIEHVNPHMFRHTFITWRIEAGLKPHEIASITGHKLSGLGALGEYIDEREVGARVRAATPPWLASWVASWAQKLH